MAGEDLYQFTICLMPYSVENGGMNFRARLVLALSTTKDPYNLLNREGLICFNKFLANKGIVKSFSFLFIARLIRRTNSSVLMALWSPATKVPAALESIILLNNTTRLSRKTMLRWFPVLRRGRG